MDRMAVLRHGASTKGRRLHNFEIDLQPPYAFSKTTWEKTRACFLKQLVLPTGCSYIKKSLDDLAFSVGPKFKNSILEYSPLPAIP